MNVHQGHLLLAKMGEKVLRPGGLELTTQLLHEFNICNMDSVVELTPGLGLTASMVLEKHPQHYTGVELNGEDILSTIKIAFNVMRNTKARMQILAMMAVFRKYQEHLCSVAIVAEKL